MRKLLILGVLVLLNLTSFSQINSGISIGEIQRISFFTNPSIGISILNIYGEFAPILHYDFRTEIDFEGNNAFGFHYKFATDMPFVTGYHFKDNKSQYFEEIYTHSMGLYAKFYTRPSSHEGLNVSLGLDFQYLVNINKSKKYNTIQPLQTSYFILYDDLQYDVMFNFTLRNNFVVSRNVIVGAFASSSLPFYSLYKVLWQKKSINTIEYKNFFTEFIRVGLTMGIYYDLQK